MKFTTGNLTTYFYVVSTWSNGLFLSSLDNEKYEDRLKQLTEKHGQPISTKRFLYNHGNCKTAIDYK